MGQANRINPMRTAPKGLRERRERRARRVRARVFGTPERPRLAVFRSHKHFYAQVIDDSKGTTLASASTQLRDVRQSRPKGGDKGAAELVGKVLAERAKQKGVMKVVLDRRHYLYHGRVKAFAEAARKGGLLL